jgi:hypothetical protein
MKSIPLLYLYLYLNLDLNLNLSLNLVLYLNLATQPRRMSRSFPKWGACYWFATCQMALML